MKTDPCVSRKVVWGKTKVVAVIRLDDTLVASKEARTMDQSVRGGHLRSRFKIKDLKEATTRI